MLTNFRLPGHIIQYDWVAYYLGELAIPSHCAYTFGTPPQHSKAHRDVQTALQQGAFVNSTVHPCEQSNRKPQLGLFGDGGWRSYYVLYDYGPTDHRSKPVTSGSKLSLVMTVSTWSVINTNVTSPG